MRKTGVEVRGGVRGDLLAHPAPFDHVRGGDVAAKQNVTLFHAMVFTIVCLSKPNCTHFFTQTSPTIIYTITQLHARASSTSYTQPHNHT